MSTPHLSDSDYTREDLHEVAVVMSNTLAVCAKLIEQHGGPDQCAQPTTSALAVMESADELLTTMSRSLTLARRELRSIDARARQRFLDRCPDGMPLLAN
ncbi:hypothetical protein ABZX56_30570 [Streptomyces parvulus]|uniref:hypothetical protein n=1 Tax=Streptomyces parvulus TaxID=146923 RepID=UPI0033B6E2DD